RVGLEAAAAAPTDRNPGRSEPRAGACTGAATTVRVLPQPRFLGPRADAAPGPSARGLSAEVDARVPARHAHRVRCGHDGGAARAERRRSAGPRALLRASAAPMILFALPILLLLGLALLLVVFVFVVELRILRYAYRKIGVPPRYMFAVLMLTLLGSYVNLPLYSVGRSVVAINDGGALVPILVSLYLFFRTRLYGRMLIGTAIVAVIVHALARIVPGVGIAVPMLI